MKGRIINIQRMSVHDGPGIRSTVFLKGCNFRCAWCHNPETFSTSIENEWIESLCLTCGACLNVCETGAIARSGDKMKFDKCKCTACGHCQTVCFPEAMRAVGREISANKLFAEIEQDFPYFRNSNGGVTFSGGEPMLQVNFVAQALTLFKKAGIHSAIETNLSVPWGYYEKIIPFTDLIMADLKMIDDDLHIKWTGKSNKSVLENYRRLDSCGMPYIIKTPVIPGINNTLGQIEPVFKFVSTLKNFRGFELLAYHPLAATKYINLGIANPLLNMDNQTPDLSGYNFLFDKYNLKN